jgi:acyl transferase domain-containing protein
VDLRDSEIQKAYPLGRHPTMIDFFDAPQDPLEPDMEPGSRLEELLASGSAVAVCGMAGRFPGARSVRELWSNLERGVESIRELSDAELEAAGVPREVSSHPSYVKAGAPLDGMDRFDAGFFGFSPRDAATLDPQHRHFLEVAWEALEDAGRVPEHFDGSVAVFAGSGANAYFWANVMTNPELVEEVGYFLLRHTGNDKDFLSTLVSYHLDLDGPSVNVQTACSTSLVAVHMAVQCLLSGEADMALAGAVTIEQPHGVGYRYQKGEILSPDGHCRAFDAESAGGVFGSGLGVVVLRRLSDAVRDGDSVRAVILGSAVNNDGANKVGYLAPSVNGQARAIAEALGAAGVGPDSLQYVEAHGSGTAVGDPIEVAALTEVFRAGTDRKGFCGLGSVKTNVGHLDTAAGVTGLIKVVQALRHRLVPPSLHFRVPNPVMDLEAGPFYVNARLRPWDAVGPRRAGVNSLGVGGTNAFVVVEEAPRIPLVPASRSAQLLLLSARSNRALAAAGADLSRALEEGEPQPLADVAFTLACGRRAFRHRRVVVAHTVEAAVEALGISGPAQAFSTEAPESPPPVSFMFAGGGAQYAGMGAGIYGEEPVYRSLVDECLALLEPTLSTRVRHLMVAADRTGDRAQAALDRPSLALPALFITQMAQSRLWMSWGVRPDSMIGHSMGEYTAACLAGVFSMADALSLVVTRGRLFESLSAGAMLSVNLSEAELRSLLADSLDVAAVNAPDLTVASGPVESLTRLERALTAMGVECRRVRISVAAHSSMLEPILSDFEAHVRRTTLAAPRIRFASNLSGDWITEEEATDPGYWTRQLRHTVRFADGVRTLLADGPRVLLEVGPGATLATLARLNVGAQEGAPDTFTSMRRPDEATSDMTFQLSALGRLWTKGVDVDWEAYYGSEERRRVSLPTYPFERTRHFIEPGDGVPLQLSPGRRNIRLPPTDASNGNGVGGEEAALDLKPLLAALNAHPAVAEAAAVSHVQGPGAVRVVAFIVYDAGAGTTVSELRRSLRSSLPSGLVPQNFVEMTSLPRDGQGRIETARLPDPFVQGKGSDAPRTPTEKTIAEIWRRLLGLERVGVHDNFLDVGGHSLVGIRVLTQIEERTGMKVPPNALTLQTLEQIAADCDRQLREKAPATVEPEETEGLSGRLRSTLLSRLVGGGKGEGRQRDPA